MASSTKLESGAVAIVGSSLNPNLQEKLYIAKTRVEAAHKLDTKFTTSKGYSEYKMTCNTATMRLQNEANLALQNEMNSRAASIDAITTVLQGTHDRCDLDSNVMVLLSLTAEPAVKTFLGTAVGYTNSAVQITPITCKVNGKLDLHTFDEFQTACKDFIRNIHEAGYPNIKSIDVIGDVKTGEYKLLIQLCMGDEFKSIAKRCGWPNTYQSFITDYQTSK